MIVNSIVNSEIFTFVFKTSVARDLSISCPSLAKSSFGILENSLGILVNIIIMALESSLRIFETTVQKNMTKRISPLNQNITHGAAIVDFD